MEENKNLDKTGTSFEDNGDISMADLVKGYDESSNIDFGKEIEATIIEENSDGFMVDLGMKSEGIIPKKEFEEGKVPTELKVGASVKVKIVSLHDQPVLSYREIVEKAKWDAAQQSFENGEHVNGTILKTIKGGFLVNVDGINAFLPISQLDTHFVKEAERYVGKSYEFVIIELDGRKKNIVISRRKIVEDEKNAARVVALASISEGQILDGTVSKIMPFGAFIDLGGVDGLLHIGELAWYKVKKVEDLLHVGQTIRVQVMKVDKSSDKISLSMKNLAPHPWESVAEKFPVGLIMKGTVTSIMDYGVFIELEAGVEGLLHASEYAWNDSAAALKREVKKGQELEVKIINVDKENKKIALSIRQMLPNPWNEVFRHYTPGAVVKGVVQNLMPFGAFVKLPEGIEGLVHISDFSWTRKIKHPEDVLKKGDEVEVLILEVNPQNEKISLSLKHVQADPYKKYKVGTIVKGKVARVADFGAFVEIEPDIEALIKNSESSSVKVDKSQSVLKEGEEVEAKIIKVNVRDKRIEASVKKLEFDREKELVKQYTNQDDKPSMGEILSEE
ncbi:MAG: 30S ribosomal protein S1 [Endomicrobium sp.]|uniref:30S ribosomal protein S1 n=1 Tax=Candidatus Endomicrobiellum pyrsonymphae TaxID=1408203 RepID=UPI00357755E7|nr:30S ribosomal protein S1 [Endomicrobium sp.]